MYQNYYPNQQQVVRVNGEAGARAYQLNAPNSSALLLDETQPVVWLAQTDGGGYKTLTPYTIIPYVKPETELEIRVRKLEEMLNGKSNSSSYATETRSKREVKPNDCTEPRT